ncbi:MAG TPA: response regulator [Candidatus Angelobacter sp.]|nr:response regulator [Candidatus Angelobacter sp.]
MKKLRVLLGGDESIRNLKDVLESWGLDAVAVADGKQACSAVYTHRFDLCLLNWDLPRMSGLAACSWIRAVNLPVQPYIVLITHQPEQIQAAYSAGADDYISGSFQLEDLRSLVATVAQRLSRTRFDDQDFRSMDPLEQYRHDLSASATLHART